MYFEDKNRPVEATWMRLIFGWECIAFPIFLSAILAPQAAVLSRVAIACQIYGVELQHLCTLGL